MPTYEYKCSCGLRFTKVKPPMKVKDTHECPKCKAQADRYISGIQYSARVSEKSDAAMVSNTGISKIDDVADQIIGSEAETNWRVIGRRKEDKIQIMQEYGLFREWQLAKTPDGGYRPLSKEELKDFARRFVTSAQATKTSQTSDKSQD